MGVGRGRARSDPGPDTAGAVNHPQLFTLIDERGPAEGQEEQRCRAGVLRAPARGHPGEVVVGRHPRHPSRTPRALNRASERGRVPVGVEQVEGEDRVQMVEIGTERGGREVDLTEQGRAPRLPRAALRGRPRRRRSCANGSGPAPSIQAGVEVETAGSRQDRCATPGPWRACGRHRSESRRRLAPSQNPITSPIASRTSGFPQSRSGCSG